MTDARNAHVPEPFRSTLNAIAVANEEWRTLPGYGYRYFVSNHGRVFSFVRTPRFFKCTIGNRGYPTVHLRRGGRGRTFTVAALVLLAFEGPCPNGLQICHNDGAKRNSHRTNLRYGTPVENMRDRDLHGKTMRGEAHARSKLTDQQVRSIRALGKRGITQAAIAAQFDVTQAYVGKLLANHYRQVEGC
jgi:hypothetical protein